MNGTSIFKKTKNKTRTTSRNARNNIFHNLSPNSLKCQVMIDASSLLHGSVIDITLLCTNHTAENVVERFASQDLLIEKRKKRKALVF